MGAGVWGGRQSPLKGDAPPPLRQDNPLPRLSSPHSPESGGDSCWSPSPCTRLILSATSGTCGTADTQIHTHSERAHSHIHTHTETHQPGRHGVSTSTQRARTRRAPPLTASAPSTPLPSPLWVLMPLLPLLQDSAYLP